MKLGVGRCNSDSHNIANEFDFHSSRVSAQPARIDQNRLSVRVLLGKSADFIVIDQDILTIDPKKINEIQVQQTYLRGKQVYQRKNAPYRRISAAEAKQMMQNTEKYILLDVRTKEEYEIEHIEETLLIPDYEIGSRAAAELPDKNALILIYCRSGRRSANVAHELIKMGYTNVYDFGGIIDWQYETIRR